VDTYRRDFLVRATAFWTALAHPHAWSVGGDWLESMNLDEDPSSRFLRGNFAPIQDQIQVEGLSVVGEIPRGLDGMLVRNGPNPRFSPLGKYHWFDGDGMLHGVRIADGKASYQNRFIETEGFRKEKKAGRALYRGLLEVPDMALVLAGKNPYKNPANTSVVFHANRLLALWEAGEPYEIKPRDLSTVGIASFDGKIKHPFTAHPKIDPKTGEMLTFGYIPNEAILVFSQIDPSGNWVRSTRIPIGKPTMVHDFAITQNYAIFPLCPLFFDVQRLLRGESPWFFDQSKPTRFAVVQREDPTQVQMIETDPCFVFHLLNAFEVSDGSDDESSSIGQGAKRIEIVGCRYDEFPGSLNFGDADDARANDRAIPYRWVLDIANGSSRGYALDDQVAEFPRLNDSYIGRPHRYGYMGLGDEEFFHGFRKLDLKTNQHSEIALESGLQCGEGVFVPDLTVDGSQAGNEDRGWLLSHLYHVDTRQSSLGIWDARSFDSNPVAMIQLPHRVPYGFHGVWIPGKGLG